jgi:F-type H+-transporting ATPase subunit a
MNMGCGCSTRILILVSVIFFLAAIYGIIIGPIGSSVLHIKAPAFLAVTAPNVELPSEGIFHISAFTVTNTLIASWLTIIVLVALFYAGTRKMKLIPGGFQNFVEYIVEVMLNFVEGVAGEKHSRTVFPIVATIFLYVLMNAYLALIPFFGTIGFHETSGTFVPFFRNANTDINVPLSIALISFVFVEGLVGLRTLGFLRYLNYFFNVGQLRDGLKSLFKGKIKPAISGIVYGFINLFIGVLEVISHFMRIISFTFRLFGNMTGGEILLLLVTFLTPLVISMGVYGLESLVGFLQALIFAGLTLVFAVLAMSSHEEGVEAAD